ncbi:CoA pyrophosphatase [Pseudothermotoga sp.]|uniref:NUDIX hydrolase n=1 Tax=Pseudothermotoga sp. TaxID=2033661 RepID=UPI000E9BEC3C|nr:CoA pyrophosphatase [Pseudothermotoga sp.]HBJ81732.1 CoA pyrophosphatase [Pseudothermotoga sp.]
MIWVERSAVTVPVILINGQPHIILIKRSRRLKRHPGQIGFPGGLLEKDETHQQAAVREMKEEIGIQDNCYRVIKQLSTVVTIRSSVEITSFLVIVECPDFHLNRGEVEDIYFVPIEIFEKISCEEIKLHDGKITCRYILPDFVIWGATAKIIRNSLEEIKEALRNFKGVVK